MNVRSLHISDRPKGLPRGLGTGVSVARGEFDAPSCSENQAVGQSEPSSPGA